MLEKIKKWKQEAIVGMALFLGRARIAYATTSDIISPITNLKTLMMDIVGAIGAIIIIKSILELATAINQNDSASTASALKSLAGGILMASISVVLKFLGVS